MHSKGGQFKDVLLRVEAVTSPGEQVCVCGNVPELGCWKPSLAIPLARQETDSTLWTGLVRLPADVTVEYRYLIVIILETIDNVEKKEIVVRRWEGNLQPRCLQTLNGLLLETQIFGIYNGQERVEPGWLIEESVVQLKFYNNPVTLWRRNKGKPYNIHVSPIDLARRDSENHSPDESEHDSSLFDLTNSKWPVIEISAMCENGWELVQQEQFGRTYLNEDYVIFQAQMLHPDTIALIAFDSQLSDTGEQEYVKISAFSPTFELSLGLKAYMVDFYTPASVVDGKPTPPEHLGFCYILPSNLRDTTGTCTMPITGKRQQPVGQLTIEYLIVRPLKDVSSDCSISYARHWKPHKQGLDVGHRGAGNARRTDKVENVLENTVASFNYAARHGADMVELDVQLSKDQVPIIYHDYYICIAMKKKKTQTDDERMQIAVKDLTAHQLQKLKLSPTDSEKHQYDFCEDDADDNQPFPTLQHVLESVDSRVGFNIEIKCPMQYRDGTWEMDARFEINNYIDIILKTILEYAGPRYIILSCFHPDICTMVRLKQNKYPLLFLTQGQTDKYPPYLDTRTSTIPMGVFFCLSMGLLGINVHTEELLRDRSLTSFIKSHNLILFCWGEDINGKDIVKTLKKDGVDGVIYDKVDEFLTHQDNVFLVESKGRIAVLEAAGHSAESLVSWSSMSTNSNNSP